MIKSLSDIREIPKEKTSVFQNILLFFILIVSGFFFGILAKHLDLLSAQRSWNELLSRIFEGFGEIGSLFGLWIFIAVLISVFSKTPVLAGFHSFAFLFSMVVGYYLYQSVYYHHFYKRLFILWSIIALFSILFGAFMWYAKGNGKAAIAICILPITAVLTEAFLIFFNVIRDLPRKPLYYQIDLITIIFFDFVFCAVLFFVWRKTIKERVFTLLFSGGLAAVIIILYIVFNSLRFNGAAADLRVLFKCINILFVLL